MNRNPHRTPGLPVVIAGILLLALLIPSGTGGLAQDENEGAEGPPTKLIKMQARNWFWDPEQIRVKQGTRVVIEIDSYDAPHAFQLKDYGIKVNLPQDKKTRVEFVADKVGEFSWRCSRPCGNGCPKMRGKLIVTE